VLPPPVVPAPVAQGWTGATGGTIGAKIGFWAAVVVAVAAVARIGIWGFLVFRWFGMATTGGQDVSLTQLLTLDNYVTLGTWLIRTWTIVLVVAIVMTVLSVLLLSDRKHTGESQVWFTHRAFAICLTVLGILLVELVLRGIALSLWSIWL
jgi:hypothetical protein